MGKRRCTYHEMSKNSFSNDAILVKSEQQYCRKRPPHVDNLKYVDCSMVDSGM